MDLEAALTIYLVGLVITLAISYVVIRLAVGHALRGHSVWAAQGGVEKTIEKRAERAARSAAELAKYQQETRQG